VLKFAQKFAAEFIGTFAVVFIAAGAICADQYLSASSQGRLGILGVALAYGLVYAAMVSALGHVSGGHFNPAVTVGLWVTRRAGTVQAVSYWFAQILGGILAGYALIAVIPDGNWRMRALGLITSDLSPDITRGQGIALEALVTFFFVFVFFATAVDAKRGLQRYSGFASGLALAAGVLVAAPFTGGSMNPVRTLGPAVATGHWENHGVYWIGPMLGGVLASVAYDWVFLRDQPPGAGISSPHSDDTETRELASPR
jgi:MIP family channel proteins